jgi:hypothetical protein
LAKPIIEPIFIAPSSIIAIAPFRYLWNNPPGFVGKSIFLALLTPISVFFVVSLGLACAMTAGWRLWKAR